MDPNLVLLNINTINVDKVNILLTEIWNYKNLKFLCLVEIGVKEDNLKNLNMTGFSLKSFYCRPNKHCGGVAIWARDGIIVKPLDLSSFCIEQHFEVCAISYVYNKRDNLLLNCYRSPSGDINVFFNKISEILNYLYKPHINLIICGDFNFDLYKNINFKSMCYIMSCFNCCPVVSWPTRVTNNSCTLIDQIFINFNNSGTCYVLDNEISDHRIVFLELDIFSDKNISANKFEIRRSYNEINMLNFEITIISNI